MKARRYFSAESAHGSESSHGFANDTTVYVFDSRAAREKYVDNSRNLSCKAIRRVQVTGYAANYNLTHNTNGHPVPFSGQFWGVTNRQLEDPKIAGLVGEIEVCHPNGCVTAIDRLY